MKSTAYHAIAAMAANRIIGRNGTMPWHLPEDLKFFKKTTLGHSVIMGRKTWDSLGRPLPGRRNLVISRTLASDALPGAEVFRDLAALDAADLGETAFIIGGAEIYQLLLPRCASVYLTVLADAAEGDTYFPVFESAFPIVEVLATTPGMAEWRRYHRSA
jgi:dihydrofolate reductase